MSTTTDTIVAPATPPGKGALHVLRLSGPEATTLLQSMLADQPVPEPGRHGLRTLVDPESGLPLDQALILTFKAPRSAWRRALGSPPLRISASQSRAIARAWSTVSSP